MTAPRLADSSVRVVGVGLLGTSIGLCLSGKGVPVMLADASPTNLELAVAYGAGRPAQPGDAPDLVVVCVPPDVTAEVVARELADHPGAVVTDVASVKSAVLAGVRERGADLSRYVGSHPMAGRERGGPLAGRADLFLGRPWVLAASQAASSRATHLVGDLALELGANLVALDPEEHDAAVALVSHAPQLLSSLMAARLRDADDAALSLAGQGLRDVTRIAASDPALWLQILGANAPAVRAVLAALREELDGLLGALEQPVSASALRTVAETLAAGNEGVARLPGKHGSRRRYASVTVAVADRPGELARLFAELGQLDINVEDLRIEHSPGASVGFAEVAILPSAVERAVRELSALGWKVAQQ